MRERIWDRDFNPLWDSATEGEFKQGGFERALREHAPCRVTRDRGTERWHLRASWGAAGVYLVDEFEFLNTVTGWSNPPMVVTA